MEATQLIESSQGQAPAPPAKRARSSSPSPDTNGHVDYKALFEAQQRELEQLRQQLNAKREKLDRLQTKATDLERYNSSLVKPLLETLEKTWIETARDMTEPEVAKRLNAALMHADTIISGYNSSIGGPLQEAEEAIKSADERIKELEETLRAEKEERARRQQEVDRITALQEKARGFMPAGCNRSDFVAKVRILKEETPAALAELLPAITKE